MDFNRNGVDLFEKCRTVGMAKELSKRFWGQASILGECRPRLQIIDEGDFFDGCHLYPAGQPRYSHLRKLPANIWPMARKDHKFWDKYATGGERPIHEKVELLIENCNSEHTAFIAEVLAKLSEMAERRT